MATLILQFLQRLGVEESTPTSVHADSDDNSFKTCRSEREKTVSIQDAEESKRVSFNKKIRVILIPTAAEYHDAGCDLWWKEKDYVLMREDFRCEIETALKSDPSLRNNLTLAMHKLYQPDNLKSKEPISGFSPASLDFKTFSHDISAQTKFVFSPLATQRKIMFVR